MDWKIAGPLGAMALAVAGFFSALPEMIAAGEAGVAAHMGYGAISTSVLQAGGGGVTALFGMLADLASKIAYPVMEAFGHALGASTMIAGAPVFGIFVLEALLIAVTCITLGSLLKGLWDKTHPIKCQLQDFPVQCPPEQSRSQQKQQMPDYGTQHLPHTAPHTASVAQVLPRGQGKGTQPGFNGY